MSKLRQVRRVFSSSLWLCDCHRNDSVIRVVLVPTQWGLFLRRGTFIIDTFFSDLNTTILDRVCMLGRTSQILSAMGLNEETNEIESSTETV
jgi:hypothetical protein